MGRKPQLVPVGADYFESGTILDLYVIEKTEDSERYVLQCGPRSDTYRYASECSKVLVSESLFHQLEIGDRLVVGVAKHSQWITTPSLSA